MSSEQPCVLSLCAGLLPIFCKMVIRSQTTNGFNPCQIM